MTQGKVTILNKIGLHARPAALLVNKAREFDCHTEIKKGDQTCDLSGVFGLLRMQCSMGDELLITCEGLDEVVCLQALTELINSKFGED